ncbi:MAG: aldolase [Candidatus Blackburnbacteria bacterium]|nr:aldolase [Candidatus Blackburnbacteria bacterium]
MLLAYDHGYEHGPADFDERSVDPAWIMNIADSGYFTGVVCQKGIAARYYDKNKHKVPLIVKLNGKTPFHQEASEEPVSVQNCTVDEALELGATGVGFTIYVGSEFENQMIKEFAKVEREAHEKGLIVIAWMYPRGGHISSDTSPDILSYCARLGLELNSDAIKIKYTGDIDSFRGVVRAAGNTKVFVVGGPKVDIPNDLYRTAYDTLEAGAVGLAIGRNVWQAKNPLEVARRLAGIVYGNEAIKL